MSISYDEINPTSYVARVSASGPFLLVLSSQYDPLWKAYLNGNEIPEHIMVNGYANAWYVDKAGPLSINISYQPQIVFYLALAVSVAAILVTIVYVYLRGPATKLVRTGFRHETQDLTTS